MELIRVWCLFLNIWQEFKLLYPLFLIMKHNKIMRMMSFTRQHVSVIVWGRWLPRLYHITWANQEMTFFPVHLAWHLFLFKALVLKLFLSLVLNLGPLLCSCETLDMHERNVRIVVPAPMLIDRTGNWMFILCMCPLRFTRSCSGTTTEPSNVIY